MFLVHTDDIELADCGFHDTESLEGGGEGVTGVFLSRHMDISEQDWKTLDTFGRHLEGGGRRREGRGEVEKV